MEGVMKSHNRGETPVKDACVSLPQDIHKAYTPEVPSSLCYEHYFLPGKLLCQGNFPKDRLNDRDRLTPFHWVRGVLPCRHLKPHVKVI